MREKATSRGKAKTQARGSEGLTDVLGGHVGSHGQRLPQDVVAQRVREGDLQEALHLPQSRQLALFTHAVVGVVAVCCVVVVAVVCCYCCFCFFVFFTGKPN